MEDEILLTDLQASCSSLKIITTACSGCSFHLGQEMLSSISLSVQKSRLSRSMKLYIVCPVHIMP